MLVPARGLQALDILLVLIKANLVTCLLTYLIKPNQSAITLL